MIANGHKYFALFAVPYVSALDLQSALGSQCQAKPDDCPRELRKQIQADGGDRGFFALDQGPPAEVPVNVSTFKSALKERLLKVSDESSINTVRDHRSPTSKLAGFMWRLATAAWIQSCGFSTRRQ